jgi:phage shock protein PspC (stress-responsive transcriptional regulator)
MQATNTLFREDTMLGVCEALGQDFGFNPLFLRIVLGVCLLWQPVGVIAVYLGLGVIVAISRLAVPNKPHRWLRGWSKTAQAEPKAEQPPALIAEDEPQSVAIAA